MSLTKKCNLWKQGRHGLVIISLKAVLDWSLRRWKSYLLIAVHDPKNSMLRNAHAKDSGPLCWATPQRFPCSPSFRALTIYIPRLSRLKGGPEPLDTESHEFLFSKRDDRFSNPFFEMVPKTCQGFVFRNCFGIIISVRARGHCESSRRSARW